MSRTRSLWNIRYHLWIGALALFLGECYALISGVRLLEQSDAASYRSLAIGIGYLLLAPQLVALVVTVFSFIQPAQSHYQLFCSGCERTYAFATMTPQAGMIVALADVAAKPIGSRTERVDVISEFDRAPDDAYMKITDSYVRGVVAAPRRQQWSCAQCRTINQYPTINIELFLLVERIGFGLMLLGIPAIFMALKIGFSAGWPGAIAGLLLFSILFLGVYLQEEAPHFFSSKLTPYELDHIASGSYTFLSGVYEKLAKYAVENDPAGTYSQRSRRIIAQSGRSANN